jgi:hypothetical protein
MKDDSISDAISRLNYMALSAERAKQALYLYGLDKDELARDIRALVADHAAQRATNNRLHRRAQAAEAALADWNRIQALPRDERGVQFVRGSLGRALLAYHVSKLEEELAATKAQMVAGPDKVLRCAFCGEAYPDGTPTHKSEVLAAHIRVCEKHPVGIENRALRAEVERLREVIEAAIRNLPEGSHRFGNSTGYRLRAALDGTRKGAA